MTSLSESGKRGLGGGKNGGTHGNYPLLDGRDELVGKTPGLRWVCAGSGEYLGKDSAMIILNGSICR